MDRNEPLAVIEWLSLICLFQGVSGCISHVQSWVGLSLRARLSNRLATGGHFRGSRYYHYLFWCELAYTVIMLVRMK